MLGSTCSAVGRCWPRCRWRCSTQAWHPGWAYLQGSSPTLSGSPSPVNPHHHCYPCKSCKTCSISAAAYSFTVLGFNCKCSRGCSEQKWKHFKPALCQDGQQQRKKERKEKERVHFLANVKLNADNEPALQEAVRQHERALHWEERLSGQHNKP